MAKPPPFDSAPLLEVIAFYGPIGAVKQLSELHDMLADYMLNDEGLDGYYAVEQLYLLRQLRNSIATGAGVNVFEKD